MSASQVFLVEGARTPIGSFGGAPSDVPAHELGGVAAAAALERSGVSGDDVGEVMMGCIAKHPARHDQELGMVTMCIVGGQAMAALFRRVGSA
jgi:acetyl-CoA acetyltransferase